MNRTLWIGMGLLAGSLTIASAQVEVTNIRPSDKLGNAVKYSISKFETFLKTDEVDPASIHVMPRGSALSEPGAVALDFEPESGFPEAQVAVEDNGAVARVPGLKFVNPAVLNGKIASILTTTPSSMLLTLEWRTFDMASKTLSDKAEINGRGVFIVTDRAANDTVSSGKQGIAWVPAEAGGHPGGILFTPNTLLKGFGFVANNQHEDYTLVMCAFDSMGKALFSYSRGFPKGMSVYLGVTTDQADIHSVWVGQIYPHDGTVLDDIILVPAK